MSKPGVEIAELMEDELFCGMSSSSGSRWPGRGTTLKL